MTTPSTEWKERVGAGEQAKYEGYAERLRDLQRAAAHGTGPANRALHAKGNCGALAELTVLPDLPEYARAGLFANPATYRAYVRYSNGSGWTVGARGAAGGAEDSRPPRRHVRRRRSRRRRMRCERARSRGDRLQRGLPCPAAQPTSRNPSQPEFLRRTRGRRPPGRATCRAAPRSRVWGSRYRGAPPRPPKHPGIAADLCRYDDAQGASRGGWPWPRNCLTPGDDACACSLPLRPAIRRRRPARHRSSPRPRSIADGGCPCCRRSDRASLPKRGWRWARRAAHRRDDALGMPTPRSRSVPR